MDPREKTQAEAALIADLIKNVVEPEVMGPMEKIGWGHGTPPTPEAVVDNPPQPGNTSAPAPAPAPVVDGQPAPAPATAPAPVASEPNKDAPAPADPLAFLEGMKDANGLYGGKYKTREEYIKGVGHVVQMAKNAFSKADLVEQEAARLRAENEKLRTQSAAPAAAPGRPGAADASQASEPVRSVKLDAVLSKLRDEGGILDEENMQALIEGVGELASLQAKAGYREEASAREAEQKAQDEKWQTVDAHMQNVAPESLQFSTEIGLFVKSTPLVSAAVGALVRSGNLNEAAELSWTLFQNAHQGMSQPEVKAAADATQVALEAGDQVRREAVEKARKDAGVGSSVATGVHESPGVVGPTQEEIDQAAAEMAAGDGTRWRALTIGRTLTDPIFDR